MNIYNLTESANFSSLLCALILEDISVVSITVLVFQMLYKDMQSATVMALVLEHHVFS